MELRRNGIGRLDEGSNTGSGVEAEQGKIPCRWVDAATCNEEVVVRLTLGQNRGGTREEIRADEREKPVQWTPVKRLQRVLLNSVETRTHRGREHRSNAVDGLNFSSPREREGENKRVKTQNKFLNIIPLIIC